MSGEDPEDKKVENPAADDDSIDDDSLDDVFEVDETFDVDGDFEVDPEAAEAIASMAEASDNVVVGEKASQQPTLDATLSDSMRLADELVKTRIEKIHEAGEESVSQLSNRWKRSSTRFSIHTRLRRQHVHRVSRVRRPLIL